MHCYRASRYYFDTTLVDRWFPPAGPSAQAGGRGWPTSEPLADELQENCWSTMVPAIDLISSATRLEKSRQLVASPHAFMPPVSRGHQRW